MNFSFTRHNTGFTLAELLIALAILGVIAVFTIPKILITQQDERYNATAKEALSSVAATWNLMRMDGRGTSNTTANDILGTMNYVSTTTDNVTTIDAEYGSPELLCGPTFICYRQHSGGTLRPVYTAGSFGGTSTTNAILFVYDPDSVFNGTTNGPSKSLVFALYYNGGVADRGNLRTNTAYNGSTPLGSAPSTVPSWFHW